MPNEKTPCPECNDAKQYRYDVEKGHPLFGRLFPCPVCNQDGIDSACGLKTHERAISLQDLKTNERIGTKKMVDAAQLFITKPQGFLSLHGNNGTGKTATLMAIVNGVIEKKIKAKYLTASELLAYLRDAFNDETKESDYHRLHELARVPVLCIDEMDKLRDTPYSREIQQELINLRYRDAGVLGTVLAWNGELNTLPWPAVVSRISEFTVVKNSDSDIRKVIGGNE